MPQFSAKCIVQSAKFKRETNHYALITNHFKEKRGFSLIELLIVITLFGLAASLVTASYLTFERNQRLRSASSQLKSDLRLVNNNATSGNKGLPGTTCNPTTPPPISPILGGWYLNIKVGDAFYSTGGDCVENGTTETSFSQKTMINFPKDIVVNRVFYDANPDSTLSSSTPLAIFFRPLSNKVLFYDGTYIPDFLSDTDISKPKDATLLGLQPQSMFTIQLSNSTKTRCYQIIVEVTGEINESQPTICKFS